MKLSKIRRLFKFYVVFCLRDERVLWESHISHSGKLLPIISVLFCCLSFYGLLANQLINIDLVQRCGWDTLRDRFGCKVVLAVIMDRFYLFFLEYFGLSFQSFHKLFTFWSILLSFPCWSLFFLLEIFDKELIAFFTDRFWDFSGFESKSILIIIIFIVGLIHACWQIIFTKFFDFKQTGRILSLMAGLLRVITIFLKIFPKLFLKKQIW